MTRKAEALEVQYVLLLVLTLARYQRIDLRRYAERCCGKFSVLQFSVIHNGLSVTGFRPRITVLRRRSANVLLAVVCRFTECLKGANGPSFCITLSYTVTFASHHTRISWRCRSIPHSYGLQTTDTITPEMIQRYR